MSFEVHVRPAAPNGRLTVAVEGEIDMATADRLGAAVREQLRSSPVLLDLSRVGFMDSSGVRLLEALLRDCDREGWDLRVRDELAPGVLQVLELTGMKEQIPFARGGEAR